jgi:hypothetical protein
MRIRPELQYFLAGAAALALGVVLAASYARLMAPYYRLVDGLIAARHPWQVASVEVEAGQQLLSEQLQLTGFVRRHADDAAPSAQVLGHVQVGEVVETPIVFWLLVLMWPAASRRQRLQRVLWGLPVFLGVEAVSTATQLLLPMAQASAILAGDPDPVTVWDRWSRFLEAGGQFAVACVAALLLLSSTRKRGSPAAMTAPDGSVS